MNGSKRRRVLERDGGSCRNCGDSGGNVELEVHHIVPRNAGGTDRLTNLATLCTGCHSAVHDSQNVKKSEIVAEAIQRRKEQGLPVGRPKKLDDALRAEAFDLRRKGVSYSAIARVIESNPDGPDEISRETIRRYCDEAGVEVEVE